MNTEITLSNDTIEKLRKLFGSFCNNENNIDIYSLFIKKTLLKENKS